MLKIARCTVDWRSIRDLNSGGATNALSHFECDPFDLLGNAPYVNLQKSFPEKGEKSRREQQILSCRKCADFNDNTMENQEEFPKCRLDFESISLRPLRYISKYIFMANLRFVYRKSTLKLGTVAVRILLENASFRQVLKPVRTSKLTFPRVIWRHPAKHPLGFRVRPLTTT